METKPSGSKDPKPASKAKAEVASQAVLNMAEISNPFMISSVLWTPGTTIEGISASGAPGNFNTLVDLLSAALAQKNRVNITAETFSGRVRVRKDNLTIEEALRQEQERNRFFGTTTDRRAVIIESGAKDSDDSITFLAIRGLVSTGKGNVGDFTTRVKVYLKKDEGTTEIKVSLYALGKSKKLAQDLIAESGEQSDARLREGLIKAYRGGLMSSK